jgi:hypothetical protein
MTPASRTTCSAAGGPRAVRATRIWAPAETRDGELRVIVVLGVGCAHPAPGEESIYVAAERLLRRLWKEKR